MLSLPTGNSFSYYYCLTTLCTQHLEGIKQYFLNHFRRYCIAINKAILVRIFRRLTEVRDTHFEHLVGWNSAGKRVEKRRIHVILSEDSTKDRSVVTGSVMRRTHRRSRKRTAFVLLSQDISSVVRSTGMTLHKLGVDRMLAAPRVRPRTLDTTTGGERTRALSTRPPVRYLLEAFPWRGEAEVRIAACRQVRPHTRTIVAARRSPAAAAARGRGEGLTFLWTFAR